MTSGAAEAKSRWTPAPSNVSGVTWAAGPSAGGPAAGWGAAGSRRWRPFRQAVRRAAGSAGGRPLPDVLAREEVVHHAHGQVRARAAARATAATSARRGPACGPAGRPSAADPAEPVEAGQAGEAHLTTGVHVRGVVAGDGLVLGLGAGDEQVDRLLFSQPDRSSLITPCWRNVNRHDGWVKRTIGGGRMHRHVDVRRDEVRAVRISTSHRGDPWGRPGPVPAGLQPLRPASPRRRRTRR